VGEATGVAKLRLGDQCDRPAAEDDRVLEPFEQLQEAEEHYNEVAANDFGYKDVARRLRDIQTRI